VLSRAHGSAALAITDALLTGAAARSSAPRQRELRQIPRRARTVSTLQYAAPGNEFQLDVSWGCVSGRVKPERVTAHTLHTAHALHTAHTLHALHMREFWRAGGSHSQQRDGLLLGPRPLVGGRERAESAAAEMPCPAAGPHRATPGPARAQNSSRIGSFQPERMRCCCGIGAGLLRCRNLHVTVTETRGR